MGAVTLEPTDVAALRDNQDEKYETIADMGHKNPTEEKLKGRNLERKVDLKNYHHGPGPMDSVLADNGNPAPHYVDPVTKGVDLSGGSSAKMHGKNISQIGSDERFPGEGTGKKGLRMDEDREAIRNLETSNANRDAGGEGINNSYAGKDGGRFDALSDDVDV